LFPAMEDQHQFQEENGEGGLHGLSVRGRLGDKG